MRQSKKLSCESPYSKSLTSSGMNVMPDNRLGSPLDRVGSTARHFALLQGQLALSCAPVAFNVETQPQLRGDAKPRGAGE